MRLFGRTLELAQKFVATLGRVVQCLLGSGVTGPESFHFFVDHIANLREIAKTQPLGGRRGLIQGELLDGSVGAGIFFIVLDLRLVKKVNI